VALYAGEEHRHVLALAFDGAPGGEDLLGQEVRGVRAGIGHRSGRWRLGYGMTTRVAEASRRPEIGSANRARQLEGRTAAFAKRRALAILVAARRTEHRLSLMVGHVLTFSVAITPILPPSAVA